MTLVTGGAGFIGHALVRALLERGESVRVLDNFDDAYDASLKAVPAGAELLRGDVRDSGTVAAALSGVDRVYHLAARAGVRESLAAPSLYVENNVGGTSALLEGMRRAGVSRLVLASSSSVYGVREGRFSERDPIAPASPYAATKLGSEHLAHAAHVTHGCAVSVCRLFTVYGPRQRPAMAIARFIAQIRRGEALTLYGDGNSVRDYTFVGDAVAGLTAAMDHTGGFHLVNIGGGAPVTLRTLVETLAEVARVPLATVSLPDQPGDVPSTRADIAFAREWLGWTPQVALREGLGRTLDAM